MITHMLVAGWGVAVLLALGAALRQEFGGDDK